MTYFVCILASRRNGTLYVGVTSDLEKRVRDHKEKTHEGFTKKYDVTMLVYFEVFSDASTAIAREKQMKKWNRAYKIELIEKDNYAWRDLYNDF